MLQLKNISKSYGKNENEVQVLKNVDLSFKRNEFVSILGPSGCGKTTMLNIIGGLDQYTQGDLQIEGKTTKSYKDSDWDAYRNSQIGFIFQNYNLISHLSIVDNVEMALSLSGVRRSEKRQKALDALNEVGLKGHSHKRPNQLSGGQLQRVAIARSIVTNPKVLLADEPTGALDSKTSKKIMDLIKEISKDRLVIMVTHNSKLAEQYSDRIIRLMDGEVIEDTNPASKTDLKDNDLDSKTKTKSPSMSFLASLKSSFNNLITKKGRTIITIIAGSVGIIGIATVLALSNGVKQQISDIQGDQFDNLPITLESSFYDFYSMDDSNDSIESRTFKDDKVYVQADEMDSYVHKNNFSEAFMNYLGEMDQTIYSNIKYDYNTNIRFLQKTDQNIIKEVFSISKSNASDSDLQNDYNLLNGRLPSNNKEIVLVLGDNNLIPNNVLNDLGISKEDELSFSSIVGKTYKFISNDAYYNKEGNLFIENSDLQSQYSDTKSLNLTIVGIVKAKTDESNTLSPGLYYSEEFYNEMHQNSLISEIVIFQKENPTKSVLTGLDFTDTNSLEDTLFAIGGSNTPNSISIYPKDIESQNDIKTYLDNYNIGKDKADQIMYPSSMEEIMKEISSIINTITLVLSAIAGVSLIVSSLMIGIITYVSVIERTKEIGIMRSLGARKKDIRRVFNAETFIIGIGSGLLGVIIVVLSTFPLNIIINNYLKIEGLLKLSFTSALGLILLSTVLTVISGLIPANLAAKKNPVEALRTE